MTSVPVVSSDEYADILLESLRDRDLDPEALGQALIFAGAKLLSRLHGPQILAGYCLVIAKSLEETGEVPKFKPAGPGAVRH